jgi:hypothetical protein
MSVWEPIAFGMLPLGSKPLNPPPELPLEQEPSVSMKISRAFELHLGGLGSVEGEEGASLVQLVVVAAAVFILLAVVFMTCRKVVHGGRSHTL